MELFCDDVLQRPELASDARFATNPARGAAREVLSEIIVEAFAALTAAQVIERLESAGIANARLNTLHDVWAHPQLKARGRWVGTPAGPVAALLPLGTQVGKAHDGPRMDAVPALGQHTDAILGEPGYERTRMDALRARGVI